MIYNVIMFVLWLMLGVAVLITGHQFPWWYSVALIFGLAATNLSEALGKALK